MKQNGNLSNVAIVGRPNVGKSTLMNRILGSRKAITEKTPGITRDKRVELANWAGYAFNLLDTGGWAANAQGIDAAVAKTALEAVEESDLLILVVNARAGLMVDDMDMANILKRTQKPVLLAANKVDDTSHQNDIWDFMSLGLGEPFPISALHGKGVADLLDEVINIIFGKEVSQDQLDASTDNIGEEHLGAESTSPVSNIDPDKQQSESAEASEVVDEKSFTEDFAVAIVGRPNVGKSTLFNRLVGTKRSIESNMPGTTRDPVDTLVESTIGVIRYVDTAGMRRQSRMNEQAEYYAMLRALESVDRSDIVLLVIDAKEGVTHQDQRLAERIESAGCPILVLLNKWDLCDTDQKESLAQQVGRRLHFLPNALLLRVSALKGGGVDNVLPALEQTLKAYKKRVSTKDVNNVLRQAQSMQSAPDGARVLYAAQVATDPPTFTLFVNRRIPATYLRYLERKLREAFDYQNTPMKIRVKQRK